MAEEANMKETNAPDISPQVLYIFRKLANKVVPFVAEQCTDGKKGGYIFLCAPSGMRFIHDKFGNPDPEKVDKCREFSRESAERLISNPEHHLSWQSRDPEHDKWGGAVRLLGGHILSFSGFPELTDEALCMSIARNMKWIDDTQITKYLGISNNIDHFNEVHQLVTECIIDDKH